MRHRLVGKCHCGKVAIAFETAADPAALQLRACACSFCRMHGTRSISDPKGKLLFEDPEQAIHRYRFATRMAEVVLCGNCGVYVGSVIVIDGATYGIVNVNILDDKTPFERESEIMDYDRESPAERIARRRARWTPAEIISA